MMRTGPKAGAPRPPLRYAERQNSTLADLSSWRYYGPATWVMVEAAGELQIQMKEPQLGTVILYFVDLTPGVWHQVPPFTGFSSGSTVGEVVVGYQ
jgi:hypothetical protein